MFSKDYLFQMVLSIPAILVAFTFHEYAHALVADRLGDKTPKFQGRLTLNPIAHIDILGFIMIIIARFGWAKPVQTNPSSYKNYYKDDLKVSVAGPVANLIIAFAFSIVMGVFYKFRPNTAVVVSVYNIIFMIIYNIIDINIRLFFFNILPLPGLDGFHILRDLFPSKFYSVADKLYKYQMLILVLFIATPLSNYIIDIPSDLVFNLLKRLINLISR